MSFLVSSTRSQIQLTRNLSEIAQENEIKHIKGKDQPIKMKNPFQKERVECILCKNKIEPNYKNVQLLSQFQSSYTGRIYGRHITGLCKIMQEKVEKEISRAQNLGLMGFMTKDPKYLKDPKLFNPERPQRPHKW